ncbi:hypothetical protein OA848_00180 [Rickettsiales bacterium]|nr:hypothetical protein [Rickettsiales bacterium]
MEVLEIIEKNSDFQILTLPFSWQSRFLNFFYTRESRKNIGLKTMDEKIQSKFRHFLKLFLCTYYKFTKIDLVLGPAIHYKQDVDWGIVSKSIGVPYIVIHKENLYASEDHIANMTKKLKLRQPFRGSHVIVHNDIVKKTWVKSKFIEDKEISSCGKLTNKTKSKSSKNSIFDVVFFSFGPGVSVSIDGNDMFPEEKSPGYHNLSRITHLEVINFAIKNPEKKVIIKPKWGGRWIDYIYKLAREENIKLNEIKNLVINENLNSFSLIENCSVVISFNSTTVLEAGIKSKYVIIPYFEEAKKNLKGYVCFKNYFNLFEIADSGKDLYKKITLGLANPKKYNRFLHRRNKLYELYVSSLKDNQVKKYIQVIEKNKIL